MTGDLEACLGRRAPRGKELSDAGEAPLKMEKMVYCGSAQQRGDLGAVSGCCKQLKLHTVVSAGKGIYS